MRWLCWPWLILLCACGAQPEIQPVGPRTPAPPAPALVGAWYTVQRGDSVSAIAQRHEVPVEDLVELNGLAFPDRLEVGQELFLYGVDEIIRRKARVARGASKPRKRSPRKDEVHQSASAPAGALVWPVRGGRISSRFGPRHGRMHKGLDIAAKPGTPIYAAAAGEVIYSDDKQRGYGNLVILRHAGDRVTVYAHNRRNLVDEGDKVSRGQQIAELGNTGRSTGPHLHFEVRIRGKARDPMKYLPAR